MRVEGRKGGADLHIDRPDNYFVDILLIMSPVVETRNSNSPGLSAETNDAEPYSASTSGSRKRYR